MESTQTQVEKGGPAPASDIAALMDWAGSQFDVEWGPAQRRTSSGVPYVTYRWAAIKDGKDWRPYLIDTLKHELVTLKQIGAVKLVMRTPLEIEDTEDRIFLRVRFAAISKDGAPVVTGNETPEGEFAPTFEEKDGEIQEAEKPPVAGYDFVAPSPTAVLHCALICHEVVKALNDSHNEYTVPWEAMKETTMQGVQFILDNPKATPEQSHENWLKKKLEDGWKLGPIKDLENKTHPLMVPYNMLGSIQKAKDMIFGAIVRAYFGV